MAYNIGEVVEIENKQFHQGDIFLAPIDGLPEGAAQIKMGKSGEFVFASGGSTGHIHAIKAEDGVKCYEIEDKSRAEGKRSFVVLAKKKPAILYHGKEGHDLGDHAWFKLIPSKKGKNIYEVFRQRVLDVTDPSNFRQVYD